MRITHTDDSLNVVSFAQKHPGWHGYAKDKRTQRAVKRALELGAIVISDCSRQFRAKSEETETAYPAPDWTAGTEKDCMRCEQTFTDATDSEYCPKCRANMNRMDI